MKRLVPLLALTLVVACAGGDDDDDSAVGDPAFEPSLEYSGAIAVLKVGGTPYEMGFQHGTLLREELLAGAEWLDNSELALLEPLAETYDLVDKAMAASYPEVIEECQGIVDAMDDPSWDMDRCMLLAYGDPVLEFISQEVFGCSQFVASGEATADGGLIHGRNLDWSEVRHIIDHPTIIVRFPDEGMPTVVYGFPGNVSPYSGMNQAGLATASNEAHGLAAVDWDGPAHTQMQAKILREASSLDEVEAFLLGEIHSSTELFVVSDGNTGEAAVFEMAPDGMSRRDISADGVVYATNHFVNPTTEPLHEAQEPGGNSPARFERLVQLMEPDGVDSVHGGLDLDGAIGVLRDTYNPVTDTLHEPELMDDGDTLANNGCIQSMVFLPGDGELHVAEGDVPIPQNPFREFTLDELFQQP
jgi:hypothetical protein